MVAGRAPGEPAPPLSGPSPEQEAWFSALQRSLELEAERGFEDITGRRERFSAFLARSCSQLPAGLPVDAEELLAPLAEGFGAYADLPLARRRNLVRQCRERLHRLRQALHPPATIAPPRLRLRSEPARWAAGGNERPGTGTGIEPHTPLGEVKGIGPRTATRLATLGLLVARDLVRHYPRDYLDYSNLLRIRDLKAGQTATVVATVRRCHVFNSPRNPNLSIQELQLQDITGRLKVSRFFAGRRFSSTAWLTSQQRQFPLGCKVAVSGLVKEGPYGLSLQDPLIEVLESPDAPVHSERIGRLLPVYGLTEGLGADRLRQAIQALLPAVERWGDPLPTTLRQQEGLPDLPAALRQIHGPSDAERLSSSRRRLVFDEFLLLQLGLLQRRQELTSRPRP